MFTSCTDVILSSRSFSPNYFKAILSPEGSSTFFGSFFPPFFVSSSEGGFAS